MAEPEANGVTCHPAGGGAGRQACIPQADACALDAGMCDAAPFARRMPTAADLAGALAGNGLEAGTARKMAASMLLTF